MRTSGSRDSGRLHPGGGHVRSASAPDRRGTQTSHLFEPIRCWLIGDHRGALASGLHGGRIERRRLEPKQRGRWGKKAAAGDAGSETMETFTKENYAVLYSDPRAHKGASVDITGQLLERPEESG